MRSRVLRGFLSIRSLSTNTFNSRKIPIVYEDKHVVIANKPYGVLSQENEADGDCVGSRLRNESRKYLRTVHRLDRVVSGGICMGKSSKATSRLSEAFRSRSVLKKYKAAVRGEVSESKSLTQTMTVGKGRRGLTKESFDSNAREAVLMYEPISMIQDLITKQPCTLLDITLVTGLKHQIRAQLASIGHPIINDTRYDASSKRRSEHGIIALHSYLLSFEHPIRGHDPVHAQCDVPWDVWETQMGLKKVLPSST